MPQTHKLTDQDQDSNMLPLGQKATGKGGNGLHAQCKPYPRTSSDPRWQFRQTGSCSRCQKQGCALELCSSGSIWRALLDACFLLRPRADPQSWMQCLLRSKHDGSSGPTRMWNTGGGDAEERCEGTTVVTVQVSA